MRIGYEVRADERRTYHIYRLNETGVINIQTNTNWNNANIVIHDENINDKSTKNYAIFQITSGINNVTIKDSTILENIEKGNLPKKLKSNINLKRSPVPVSTYVRNDISNIPDKETYESKVGLVDDINEVWEIWEVFLNNKTNIYVIIYADCITNDYTFFKWENITYKGFYSTKQEAINEIKGYL